MYTAGGAGDFKGRFIKIYQRENSDFFINLEGDAKILWGDL
jgi:hypothetical protein